MTTESSNTTGTLSGLTISRVLPTEDEVFSMFLQKPLSVKATDEEKKTYASSVMAYIAGLPNKMQEFEERLLQLTTKGQETFKGKVLMIGLANVGGFQPSKKAQKAGKGNGSKWQRSLATRADSHLALWTTINRSKGDIDGLDTHCAGDKSIEPLGRDEGSRTYLCWQTKEGSICPCIEPDEYFEHDTKKSIPSGKKHPEWDEADSEPSGDEEP